MTDARSAGSRPAARWARALGSRLKGPGGWYNLGNATGLAAGLSVCVAASRPGGQAEAMLDHLAGSGVAATLTGAMLVFFASGEAYHRAWSDPRRPNPRLGRLGDLLSGLGATGLTIAAAMLGQGVLVAAGAVHAGGKLASAAGLPAPPGWPAAWPDPYRSAVLGSRLPALAGAALATWAGLAAGAPGGPERVIPPVLVICHLMWMRADLLLARGPRATWPDLVPS